jgi:mono/diheme cytochrome c family protein
MKKAFYSIFAILIAFPAWACDAVVHRAVVREKAVVVEAPYVTPATLALVTPAYATSTLTTQIITQFVPTYGAGYVQQAAVAPYVAAAPAYAPALPICPPQQAVQPTPSLSANDCTEILVQLKKLNARMDSLEGRQPLPSAGPPPTMPPAASAPRLPAAFASRCAVCHTAGKLDPMTTFTLLAADGTLAPLTDRQTLAIARKVRGQKMPPPGNKAGVPPLTEPEAVEILDWIETAANMPTPPPAQPAVK